jgi:hypothetical protein
MSGDYKNLVGMYQEVSQKLNYKEADCDNLIKYLKTKVGVAEEEIKNIMVIKVK